MDIIRQARKAAGLTQSQLASILGVTQGAIAQWENGVTHPSYGVLKPLSAAINVPLDELLTVEAKNDGTCVPDDP